MLSECRIVKLVSLDYCSHKKYTHTMPHQLSFKSVPLTTIGLQSSLQLPEIAGSLDINKPLLVTDQGIVGCGLLKPVMAGFEDRQIDLAIYADVVADPPQNNVLQAVAFAKQTGCDGVIGFGGGSSMDVAKLLAVLLKSDQPLSEMYGVDQVKGSRVPLIQVPTTAGTGSEATAVAIVTTGKSTKAGVVSPLLMADHIVLDANLTLGVPAHTTAATGIDAMVHAIEAFTSKRLKNPISDMLALKALTLLSANIKTAVKTGSDIEARSAMLLGAMLAGQAFANAPVAAVHALAYPLGGTYHITHGLSNSLVLPHVIRFNASIAGELYLQLADHLHDFNVDKYNSKTIGDALADHFYTMASELGLPVSLQQVDIKPVGLPELAQQAMLQTRLLINNPRELSYDDALAIYTAAYGAVE